MSHSLVRTERDAPSEAQLISHQLLMRAGLVRQLSTGIYSLTPLATRVINRITQIVKEEMDRIGGQEILLPVVQPATLWEQSGRYKKIDASLARWKDRNGQNMVLAMTHEEAVTDLVQHFVHSYRQLPMMVYQVQTKFRDEPRPRGGMVRLREFLMKDAYSFHADEASLDSYYDQVIEAYERFYKRCGVNVIRVQADTGMMGGGVSHEFMVLSNGGEDTLLVCRNCGYAANREVAVATKQLMGSREVPLWKLYIGSDGVRVAVGVLKGAGVSDTKLARALGLVEVREASPEERDGRFPREGWLDNYSHELHGMHVVLDDVFSEDALSRSGFYHLADITAVRAGDLCVNCGEALEAVRGIEVGNTFKLGTYYSQPMQALFTARDGTVQPLLMGCYGIGISRMLACIIEENHDEQGILWPESVAPYRYHLVTVGTDADVLNAAEEIYGRLGPDQVLFDDRDTTAGVKFYDADLLGLPYRLTVSGKSLSTGSVELKNRRTGEQRMVPLDSLEDMLPAFTGS